jgi:hypothetical protein
MQPKSIAAIVVLCLVAAALLLYGFITITSTPAYEFKTGYTTPAQINDMLAEKGTAVINIEQNLCPICPPVTENMTKLQS